MGPFLPFAATHHLTAAAGLADSPRTWRKGRERPIAVNPGPILLRCAAKFPIHDVLGCRPRG